MSRAAARGDPSQIASLRAGCVFGVMRFWNLNKWAAGRRHATEQLVMSLGAVWCGLAGKA